MFYKVQWDNNFTSWIPEIDVSTAATDAYWLQIMIKPRLEEINVRRQNDNRL